MAEEDNPKTKILTPEEILQQDLKNEGDLTKLQREYRSYAQGKFDIKRDMNKLKNLEINLRIIKKEAANTSVKLNVACGPEHIKVQEHSFKEIERHIVCQELIEKQILETNNEIAHLRSQIARAEKCAYAIRKTTDSESIYLQKMARAGRALVSLENNLEVARKIEAGVITQNMRLRSVINDLLVDRALFNKLWRRMVKQLSYDKKFLTDMIERAILAFNQGEDLCSKLDTLRERGENDKKQQVEEMSEMIQNLCADHNLHTFLSAKGKKRIMFDLESREYARRDLFKETYSNQIENFKRIIENCKNFSGFDDIVRVVERFQKHEDEYFAHFNYMNELNHNVSTLNQSMKFLYNDIDGLKEYNDKKLIYQKETLAKLGQTLTAEKKKTAEKTAKAKQFGDKIAKYFSSIDAIFKMLRCDTSEIRMLLGDHTKIGVFNVKRFLTILETRLNEVMSFVYTEERRTARPDTDPRNFVVRGVERAKIEPVPIEDIVLVQQCAECAEGEDVNRYDDETVLPVQHVDVQTKLNEKVKAPEMQYRLHNISKCRLPRSRLLVNKRYLN